MFTSSVHIIATKTGRRCLEAARHFTFEAKSTFAEKLKGLLGTQDDAAPIALFNCHAIHTFGMTYPIDVAFVSAAGRVLKVARNVAPGSQLHHKGSWCVLERPCSLGAWFEVDDQLEIGGYCAKRQVIAQQERMYAYGA